MGSLVLKEGEVKDWGMDRQTDNNELLNKTKFFSQSYPSPPTPSSMQRCKNAIVK